MLNESLSMLAEIIKTADKQGSRHMHDLIADRLRICATEATMLACMSRLANMLKCETGYFRQEPLRKFIAAQANTAESSKVLAWLRVHANANLAVAMAAMQDEAERAELCAGIELPASGGCDTIPNPIRSFDIGITVESLAPIAHGADTKAGNATLFRRQMVLGNGGATMSLPLYSGNALRGAMRDILADHLLGALGLAPRRDKPPVALWFFYCLYSGGVLAEKSTAQKNITAKLGANGALRCEGIRQFRDMLPSLSLLGCAVAQRIIPGRIQVADLRPRCVEWGTGDKPSSTLFDWVFLTRREDYENHDENNSMIAVTEALKPGNILDGGIDTDGHCSEIEKSALATALQILQAKGYLGAESRRGFGKCKYAVAMPDGVTPEPYYDFLASRKADILAYLNEIGAMDKDKEPPADEKKQKGEAKNDDKVDDGKEIPGGLF